MRKLLIMQEKAEMFSPFLFSVWNKAKYAFVP